MRRIDWTEFGAAIRAKAIIDAKGLSHVQTELGLSHARMINAAQGKPVGTEIFLTICEWLGRDALSFLEGATS